MRMAGLLTVDIEARAEIVFQYVQPQMASEAAH